MTGTTAAAVAGAGSGRLAGHTVGRVGFGAMQLAERGPHAAPDPDAARAVLRRAVELGVDHIDTAGFYGDGAANELIRSALHPYPAELVLVTKVGAEHDPSRGLVPAQRPDEIRASVEADLVGLGVDTVPVVNLRRLDQGPGIIATGDQQVDLDSQLAELTALRDEGKIGAVGLSGVDAGQLRRALPVGIACVQNYYNLLDRSGEALLDLCRDRDVAWVPFFPLGSAFASTPKVTAHPAVVTAAAALGVTAAQVGLAWLLGHAPDILLIPGTSSPAHLAENVAAGTIHLDPGTVSVLDGLAAPSATV